MIPGTAGWLKNVLNLVPDETKIVISISEVYFPLAGKIDKVIMTFSLPDQPDIVHGEEVLCIFPYEGPSEPTKKFDPDDLTKN